MDLLSTYMPLQCKGMYVLNKSILLFLFVHFVIFKIPTCNYSCN